MSPCPLFTLSIVRHAVTAVAALFVSATAIAQTSAPAKPALAQDDVAKEQYRRFALSHEGDVGRGRAIFADENRVACVRCHTVDGKGGHAGPDLFAAGDKFTRRDLIEAILRPSANIAVGYTTTIVKTKAGDVIEGIVKEATDDSISLMGADAKLVRVPLADVVQRRTSDVSLMPEGLEAGLTQPEFADLIEYVSGLRLPETADANAHGMPARIPELRSPITLVPVNTEDQRFNHPCWVGQIPGEEGQLLVCEHETGRAWRLKVPANGGEPTKKLWGDFASEIRRGGATGLLGVAFHPHFRENHKYYIQHELMDGGQLVARVSEKVAADDFLADSGKPSRTVIQLPCTTDVHAGGGIEFGPDGYLYIGMGDTGPQGDPQGHGQDVRLPLGKMLRIDVDHQAEGRGYAVPADNPFAAKPGGACPEIFAYGFREPWRFSFDTGTGDLWVGDVGQDRIEEVDLVRRGENYGWNVYEGFELFSNRYRTEGASYVPPVFAYSRKLGNSITGGYVYRADPKSPFFGAYVCGDYNSKRVWALRQRDRRMTSIWQIATCPERLASFGRDDAGNLLAVGYEGTIYRLDLTTASPEVAPATAP